MPKASPCEHSGKLMKHMVAQRTAPRPAGSYNPNYVPMDAHESARNQAIAANMRTKSFMGNIITRVVLPKDGRREGDIEKAQRARQAEFMKQSAMPWGSQFMHTPTDTQRLNNPSQSSFVKQRQLTIPNSYGQFYAFMHAMAAAFGQLQQ